MKGSEHLVLRGMLGLLWVFLCIHRNTKPLHLPAAPMLGGFHRPSEAEETSLSVETMSVWSQSVNKKLCDKKHGNRAAFHLPVRPNRNTLFWIAWPDFHPHPQWRAIALPTAAGLSVTDIHPKLWSFTTANLSRPSVSFLVQKTWGSQASCCIHI